MELLGSKRRGGPHSLPLHDPGRGAEEQSLKGTDVVQPLYVMFIKTKA